MIKSGIRSGHHEYTPGRRELTMKVVDILGNDTVPMVEVTMEVNDSRREAKEKKRGNEYWT